MKPPSREDIIVQALDAILGAVQELHNYVSDGYMGDVRIKTAQKMIDNAYDKICILIHGEP